MGLTTHWDVLGIAGAVDRDPVDQQNTENFWSWHIWQVKIWENLRLCFKPKYVEIIGLFFDIHNNFWDNWAMTLWWLLGFQATWRIMTAAPHHDSVPHDVVHGCGHTDLHATGRMAVQYATATLSSASNSEKCDLPHPRHPSGWQYKACPMQRGAWIWTLWMKWALLGHYC